jgi:hypothetical protein
LQPGEPKEKEILWLRYSHVLSRDAQFDLDFAEQIGIMVEISGQWLRRIPPTKQAECDDGNEVDVNCRKTPRKTLEILYIDLCRGDN